MVAAVPVSQEVRDLALRAARVFEAQRRLAVVPDTLKGQYMLPAEEVKLLKEAGLSVSESVRRGVSEARLGPITDMMTLLEDSLNVREAGELLGVNESRVRQRIRDRSLAAILDNGAWAIPRFQFAGERLIPGFAKVYRAAPDSCSIVSFYRWFSYPNVDLEDPDNDAPMSPRDWLLQGHSPDEPARIAEFL